MRFILVVTGFKNRKHYNIPVAGLEQSKAQSILFTLRRAASSEEEEDVSRDWLIAWQLAYIANSRLLHELDEVQANLKFWDRRVQRGKHFWFMLLQQGPTGFYRRVKQLVSFRRATAAVPLLTQAEMVEKRVLIFRLLRTALCEAIAGVQRAGALLYLTEERKQGRNGGDREGSNSSSESGVVVVRAAEDESLFERASRAIEMALQQIEQSFQQLQSSAHEALGSPVAQQLNQAEEVGGQEEGMLSQTVQKVLGLRHLNRLLSMRESAGPDLDDLDDLDTRPSREHPSAEAGAPGALRHQQSEASSSAAAAGGTRGTDVALYRAKRAMGLTKQAHCDVLEPLPASATAHAALAGARLAARRIRRHRVIDLPPWLLMPSELQQHWIRYSLVSLGAGYVALFLYRHSRLSGSRDLEVWARKGISSVEAAVKEHVARPLKQVKDELFNTFRRRPTIVSMDEYVADRESFQRMLDDFKADFVRRRGEAALPRAPPPSQGAVDGAAGAAGPATSQGGELVPLPPPAALEGMQLVMRCYEQELKKPIRNLINGELARSLLIQVQKMKLDTESAMLEMDQILRANELSISLVAAVPSFLFAGAMLYSFGRWITPTPPDPRWEAVPCRLGMVEVARALEQMCQEEEEEGSESAEALGWYYYCLAVEYEEASALFRRHTSMLMGGSSRSEWPALKADLIDLATPAPAHQRMRTANRMMRGYSVFQQF